METGRFWSLWIEDIRWRIETAFQTLKDRLQIENFTGTKPILLEQDIYSTIYVSNLAEDIARDIEQEQENHLKNDYKHRMAVNRTLCKGKIERRNGASPSSGLILDSNRLFSLGHQHRNNSGSFSIKSSARYL